jgi:hypothetical protein
MQTNFLIIGGITFHFYPLCHECDVPYKTTGGQCPNYTSCEPVETHLHACLAAKVLSPTLYARIFLAEASKGANTSCINYLSIK